MKSLRKLQSGAWRAKALEYFAQTSIEVLAVYSILCPGVLTSDARQHHGVPHAVEDLLIGWADGG